MGDEKYPSLFIVRQQPAFHGIVSQRSMAFAFSLASFMESLAAFLKTVPVSLE